MAGSVRILWLALLAVLNCSVAGAQALVSASLCEPFAGCGPPLARATTSIGVVAIDTIELGSSPLNNTLLPNGYIVTLSGDLGNLDMHNPPACIRQGGVIVGGSFIAGFDTIYDTPGTRTVNATLQKCVWTLDPSSPDGIGLVPDAALFTVSGTFTVLPSGGPAPIPTPSPTPTPSLQAVLIDPVESTINSVNSGGPSFIDGNSVSTDSDLLAQATVEVGGVAADGVTQVLVKVTGDLAGDTLALTVINDQNAPSTSAEEDGGLIAVDGNLNKASNTVQAQPSSPGDGGDPVAFVLYRAPLDFSRGGQDDLLGKRAVSIQVQSQNFSASSAQIQVAILRAPVVLVHGIWSGPETWESFGSLESGLLLNDDRFSITLASYNDSLAGQISLTSPRYSSKTLQQATTSSLGLAFNAPTVLSQTIKAIRSFRQRNGVASVQADIVAHSMGGLLTREERLLPEYPVLSLTGDSLTFGQGPVHKLITIATPHLGSPLATQLLEPANSCMRAGLARFGHKLSLAKVVLDSGQSTSGAVGDLNPTGRALAELQGPKGGLPAPLRTAFIAGKMSPENLSGLSCSHIVLHNSPLASIKKCLVLLSIRGICGKSSLGSSPLAQALTPEGWPGIFGGEDSDAIVGLKSQLNGAAGVEIPGLIHTPGFEKINFLGPAELDDGSGVCDVVIQLLNESSSGKDYQLIAP